jgi:hypothetical protein
MSGGKNVWQVRDQPTVEAYKHLEDYDFQVMVWEDDVWYMELLMYPPSTDDAYKIVGLSICGPTSRWQMMRHWNVINPGDDNGRRRSRSLRESKEMALVENAESGFHVHRFGFAALAQQPRR